MTVGMIVRIIQAIILPICGTVLCTYGMKPRFAPRLTKIFLIIGCTFVVLLGVGNTWWFRYSGTEYGIIMAFCIIITKIDFKESIFKIIAVNGIFWENISVFQYVFLCVDSWMHKNQFLDYISYKTDFWYTEHLVMMMLLSLFAGIIVIIRRDLFRDFFDNNLVNILISGIIIAEEIIITLLQNDYSLGIKTSISDMTGIFSIYLVFFLVSLLVIISSSWVIEKNNNSLTIFKQEILETQFKTAKNLYNSRNEELHNIKSRYIYLYELIKKRNYNQAEEYIKDLADLMDSLHIKQYTGIDSIDLILNYKIQETHEDSVKYDFKFEALTCPLDDSDIMIVLGNLLDNAIEAVRKLPEEERAISLKMASVNRAFIIMISNNYTKDISIINHDYVTTKKSDPELHGYGLKSVKKIVEKYGGITRISHDDRFVVEIIVFEKRGDTIEYAFGN